MEEEVLEETVPVSSVEVPMAKTIAPAYCRSVPWKEMSSCCSWLGQTVREMRGRGPLRPRLFQSCHAWDTPALAASRNEMHAPRRNRSAPACTISFTRVGSCLAQGGWGGGGIQPCGDWPGTDDATLKVRAVWLGWRSEAGCMLSSVAMGLAGHRC